MWSFILAYAECISEEHSLQDDNDDDGGQGEVQAISDGESEDLSEVLELSRVIDGETRLTKSHDGSVVELVGKGKDGETDDGDSTGTDRVVPRALENDTGTTDGVSDGRETGLSRDDVGSTTNSTSVEPSTAIPMLAQDKAGAVSAPPPATAQRRPKPRRYLTILYLGMTLWGGGRTCFQGQVHPSRLQDKCGCPN